MPHPLTRRQLLRSGTLATAALALAPRWAAAQPHASAPALRLGMASYTFRQFDRAQLIGFLQILGLHDLNAKDVKDHLPVAPPEEANALASYRAAGITLHAVGTVPFPHNDPNDIRAKFDYARRAGVPVIVAGDPTPENLPLLETFVRQYNIRLAIHNHGPEDPRWHSPLDVLHAVQGMDPRMGCCLDVGHCLRAGTDVVQAIHAVGPRLFNVHMKDLTDTHDRDSQVAVGDGILPVKDIFTALRAANYRGFVDLEYEVHPDDPMPGVTRSIAYMRGVIASMGKASA